LWENLALFCIVANTPLVSLSLLDISLQSLDSVVSIPVSKTSVSNSEQLKLPNSSNFELYLHSLDIQANFTKLVEVSDLSNVHSEYHEFANIFSKTKAKVLAPYHPYDLKINLEEGTQPLVGPIYSLSASEQETLKKFIEENLNTDFI